MHALALPSQLSCFDVSEFPLVRLDWPHLCRQRSDTLTDDTFALVEAGAPFVLLIENLPMERKERQSGPLRWFKSASIHLDDCCRAVIVIEADPSRRTMLRLDTGNLEKAFGTDVFMSPDLSQAELLSHRLLETPPIPRDAR